MCERALLYMLQRHKKWQNLINYSAKIATVNNYSYTVNNYSVYLQNMILRRGDFMSILPGGGILSLVKTPPSYGSKCTRWDIM